VRKFSRRENTHRKVSLARALSKLSYSSRSQATRLIQSGAVTLNRKQIRNPAFRCNPSIDEIRVDGKKVFRKKFAYLALNKPRGIVTTRADEKGRKTIYDHLDVDPWLFPVGRLDKDSEGLLLLTNDTQLGNPPRNSQKPIACSSTDR
jgi:23S rRNA pseudouridine2605 synthase